MCVCRWGAEGVGLNRVYVRWRSRQLGRERFTPAVHIRSSGRVCAAQTAFLQYCRTKVAIQPLTTKAGCNDAEEIDLTVAIHIHTTLNAAGTLGTDKKSFTPVPRHKCHCLSRHWVTCQRIQLPCVFFLESLSRFPYDVGRTQST